MRTVILILAVAAVVLLITSGTHARDPRTDDLRYNKTAAAEEAYPEITEPALMMSAASDTYCIVWYDFELLDWQGWTSIDNNAQIDTFFHVDDFRNLGGGTYDRLAALQGSKSLWCGTRPGTDFYMCSWYNAPGYGNGWNQMCESDVVNFNGLLHWSYKCVVDSEPDWDITYIEYDAGNGNWTEVAHYDGIDTIIAEHQLLLSQVATKLRFHFVADGAWSDQDGLYDTDGAVIIDSITVRDSDGLIDYEDFEGFAHGYKGDMGFWRTTVEESFGSYAALRMNLIDKDPCGNNFSSQVTFWGNNPSADYPGMQDTPYCTGPGGISDPCQAEHLLSPVIDMLSYSSSCDENQDTPIPAADAAQLGGAILRFTIYRDLPLANLVFYNWSVRNIVDGCPQQWQDRTFVYYGGDRDYIQSEFGISDLVGALPMQVVLGVVDMCDNWYAVYGDCATHTPAPYFDNVRIQRYKTVGPSWSVRNLDLFQDTFPQEVEASSDPMEEYCRADMANDIAPGDEFTRIDPGDSAVVQLDSPLAGGLDTLGTGEARVFFHCNVHFLGPDGKPDLYGPSLEGSYGSYYSDDGDWTIILCEPAATSAGNFAPDKYAIDLNDSLFTRGYMIEYYFKAWDLDGYSSTYPENAEEPDGGHFEFTCLPSLRTVPGELYCDDYHNRGTFDGLVQTYYDPATKATLPSPVDTPDRYDTNGPSSGVSNGIGAYTSVTDASSIFCTAYEAITIDCGDLNSVTVTEGTENSDKSNDARLLVDWLNITEHKVGLLVMGDQVAYDLSNSAAPVSLELVNTICGVTLVNESYYDMTGGRIAGGVISPLITGVTGGPFNGIVYNAFGGCPIINSFDVLEKAGPGQYALQYPEYNGEQFYAGIYTDQLNDAGQPLRTVWVGHSFMAIRNATEGILARNQFLADIRPFFQIGSASNISNTEIPRAYSLEQNFPNPFNPTTRIRFALPKKGHVSLKIYNVAGQLIKTLQNGVMDTGYHDLAWDGTNNTGSSVASGVYFYRLNAGDDYVSMKKMVLLR